MTPPPELPCFTREEVAQHKMFKDCWVILHGEVYDVTEWLAKHPGGGGPYCSTMQARTLGTVCTYEKKSC